MHTSSKISQAKAKLLVDYPYFGTLASKLELVLNDDIQAFKSDGKKLEYSSDFLLHAELSELEFVLANGAMHSVLAHDKRKHNRSGWLWQMATDIAINDMLIENGLNMPQDAQYRIRFKGMYAEEIYAELKDDILREDEGLEYQADDSEDVEQNSEQEKEKLQENTKLVGDYYKLLFLELQKKYNCIGDVRGSGLFLGIEIIKENSIEPDMKLACFIKNELRNQHILISTDGPFDNVLKTKPPLCFTKENARKVVDTIDTILKIYYKETIVSFK